MHLTLSGRVPSKKNSKRLVLGGDRPRLIPSAAHAAWHEEQLWRLKGCKSAGRTSNITITFFPPTAQKFDLSNAAESVIDLLVDSGVLEDDDYRIVPVLHLVSVRSIPSCQGPKSTSPRRRTGRAGKPDMNAL
jgi:hypothetical protein